MPQVRREDRKGHASCASGEVCANSVISEIKKLKKTLDTAGVVRDGRLFSSITTYRGWRKKRLQAVLPGRLEFGIELG